MKRIVCDWNELNNLQEIEIIKKYADIGRFITLIATRKQYFEFISYSKFDYFNSDFNCLITVFVYVSTFYIILVQFLSNIFFNTISDKNESRPRQLPILVECFIDQQKYFFLILILLCVAVICGLTMVIATDTVNMSYVHHACGLFEIAR